QSWAVLGGGADPDRAAQAMQALDRELVRPDPGLILLFTPPFDAALGGMDPGYIAGYPPGVRENGGQYSHAAMWAIMAQARLGHATQAVRLFAMVNPINHALTARDAQRYRVEPYAVAADVYSVAPHAGRGGWTWYTGSAAWMYRAAVEDILGLHRDGDHMLIAPGLPDSWPGFAATLRVDGTTIDVVVQRQAGAVAGDVRRVLLDGRPHQVTIIVGGSD
ncbi:MAG: hypothetical protein L0G27_05055, partial [Paracoccus sp. (in: a-proteobacteria)]|nr:hypothetical protein [Paracoccus sp. (in: a-proteobacteria)]